MDPDKNWTYMHWKGKLRKQGLVYFQVLRISVKLETVSTSLEKGDGESRGIKKKSRVQAWLHTPAIPASQGRGRHIESVRRKTQGKEEEEFKY